MKIIALVCAVLVAAILLVAPAASAAPGNVGFGFNATGISGFPTGAATLTGGGAYNPTTGFVNSAGGFRCTSDVRQGPLSGCLAGQGVRWDTVDLLRSTTFKCTGYARVGQQRLSNRSSVIIDPLTNDSYARPRQARPASVPARIDGSGAHSWQSASAGQPRAAFGQGDHAFGLPVGVESLAYQRREDEPDG
jgi:hypothetical protein